MADVRNGIENIRGVLDIADRTFDSVDQGIEIVNGIKGGSIVTNYRKKEEIEKSNSSMKNKFYILWVLVIVVTILICILF